MSGIDVWSEIIPLVSPLSLSPLTVAVFVVIIRFCWYGKDRAWFRYLEFGIFALLLLVLLVVLCCFVDAASLTAFMLSIGASYEESSLYRASDAVSFTHTGHLLSLPLLLDCLQSSSCFPLHRMFTYPIKIASLSEMRQFCVEESLLTPVPYFALLSADLILHTRREQFASLDGRGVK
jgi:hypothetical protein